MCIRDSLSVDEDITGLMDKITCLAAPYIPFDGMNDAGVSCAIYMTYQGPDGSVSTGQDTDKPDITSTTMLRLILDYAGSVEEAVELVSAYDLHDSATSSYHYMVADATGRSAILEWVGDKDATDTDGSVRQLRVTYNDQDPGTGPRLADCNQLYCRPRLLRQRNRHEGPGPLPAHSGPAGRGWRRAARHNERYGYPGPGWPPHLE